jgi:hypothetical protein
MAVGLLTVKEIENAKSSDKPWTLKDGALASPIVATAAVAVSNPTPGISAIRLLAILREN